MNGRLFAWTGMLLTVAAPALADTVVLKNGRVLTGRVVSDENDTLVLEVADGNGKITIHKAEVVRVLDSRTDAKRDRASTAGDASRNPSVDLGKLDASEIERRLRALGPAREELLAALEPTPQESAELARLEKALDSGTPEDASRLASKGRAALVVSSRALSAPNRRRRAAAALSIATLAEDERVLPYVVALDIPEQLVAALADASSETSPEARVAARHALETIARKERTDSPRAVSSALTAEERVALAEWREWWARERSQLESWEKEKDSERRDLVGELARRGLARTGRIDVRLSRPGAAAPPIPEAELALPRLKVAAPSAIRLGERDGQRVLRFSVVLENRGTGPLELVGEPENTSPARDARSGSSRAVQRVYARYEGDPRLVVERERTVGRLAPLEKGGHWHLEELARAELQDETFAPAVGSGSEEGISACLRDVRRLASVPGPEKPVYEGCSVEKQGLSPGWSAACGCSLGGHEVAVTGTPDGVYYLVVSVRAPLEGASSEDDLVAAARIRISGKDVTLLEALDGRAFLARRHERERAKGNE